MQLKMVKRLGMVAAINTLLMVILLGVSAQLAGQARAQEPAGPPNLVRNGNFEFGFYQVPELGFEPPEVGNVPIDWNWYRNTAYGKYNIYNNQKLGIVCPDDTNRTANAPETEEDSIFGPVPDAPFFQPNNSLSLHMQSTDQQDARLGVYQTVNVTPGQSYQFSISGTIQVQAGARTLEPPDPEGTPIPQGQNNTFELFFDHTGGTNWKAIPFEQWTNLPIKEQKLFFTAEETEKKGETALSEIETYQTVVTAKSNKMTIFITAWRKWANYRTTIFTIDCVSLVPISRAAAAAPAAAAPEATPASDVQPAAVTEAAAPPATAVTIIPDSGGILEKAGNSLLIIIASVIVIAGLVGAGVWNMRRR